MVCINNAFRPGQANILRDEMMKVSREEGYRYSVVDHLDLEIQAAIERVNLHITAMTFSHMVAKYILAQSKAAHLMHTWCKPIWMLG